jgi:hypothetical protein
MAQIARLPKPIVHCANEIFQRREETSGISQARQDSIQQQLILFSKKIPWWNPSKNWTSIA